jgi:hypothetical protein
MRTPESVIDELMDYSRRFTRLGVAVLLEREWRFVTADSNGPLDELNKLVRSGGRPIGLVGYAVIPVNETAKKLLSCYSRIFPEWQEDQQITRHFETLITEMMEYVERQCGESMLGDPNYN